MVQLQHLPWFFPQFFNAEKINIMEYYQPCKMVLDCWKQTAFAEWTKS